VKKITLKTLDTMAQKFLESQYSLITENSVKEQMESILKDCFDQLVLNSLGLERGWRGELSIRYNGSFAKIHELMGEKKLNNLSAEVYQKLLKELNVETMFELLTPTDKKGLVAHAKRIYKESLMRGIEDEVESRAQIDAQAMVEKLLLEQEEE